MKTLNEVIEILEKFWICPSSDEANEYCELWSVKDDALQYLKAYKDDRNDLTALRAYWKEQHENPPLTWDELKQMEGKPVWVEGYYPSSWCIVRGVQVNKDGTEDIVLDGLNSMIGIGRDDKYGTGWQAFRKERS